MGIDPTIFARPAAPRVSVALVVVTALGVFGVTQVHSPWVTIAVLLAAAVTWRIGPLIGGIITGGASALVVMLDPYLDHPLPLSQIILVVGVILVGMVTGMVARRDSARSEQGRSSGRERPTPPKSRPTPVRAGRPVTGDQSRIRADAPRGRAAETPVPRSSSAVPRQRIELINADHSKEDVERDVVRRFLRDVRDVLGADEVALWEVTEETDDVTAFAAAVQDPNELKLQTKPPVDTLIASAALGGTATNYDNEANYFLAIPAGAEGRFHGALGVYAEDRQAFARDRAKQTLKTFSAGLAQLLDLLYDGRETRRYKGKAEDVATGVENIQKQQEMSPLAAAICLAAQQVSRASSAALVLWEPGEESGTVVHFEPPGSTPPPIVLRESLVGMVLKPGATPLVRENFRNAGVALFSPNEQGVRPASVVAVPLVKDDEVIGAIVVMGDQAAQVTSVEANLLKPLARFAFTAVKKVKELEHVKGQATKDALTGLANRRAFDDRMKQLLASSERMGQKVSLILADVDRFKGVNDTYGHEAGDEVLKAVAGKFAESTRGMDMCFRYGGEELAIILPQTNGKLAGDVAERLRRKIEEMEIPAGEHVIKVTVSFGVACYPDTVEGQENLFKAADEALYVAKHEGRNQVRFAESKRSTA